MSSDSFPAKAGYRKLWTRSTLLGLPPLLPVMAQPVMSVLGGGEKKRTKDPKSVSLGPMMKFSKLPLVIRLPARAWPAPARSTAAAAAMSTRTRFMERTPRKEKGGNAAGTPRPPPTASRAVTSGGTTPHPLTYTAQLKRDREKKKMATNRDRLPAPSSIRPLVE
jgi:hypothetical protein